MKDSRGAAVFFPGGDVALASSRPENPTRRRGATPGADAPSNTDFRGRVRGLPHANDRLKGTLAFAKVDPRPVCPSSLRMLGLEFGHRSEFRVPAARTTHRGVQIEP